MRSVFYWRLLTVIMITLLLASLLMTGGYMYSVRGTYTSIKLTELTPEAEAIGQIYSEHALGLLDRETFFRLVDKLMEAAEATCIITDKYGNDAYHSVDASALKAPSEVNGIYEDIQKTLSGGGSSERYVPLADKSYAISVSVPVIDADGNITGCVFLMQSTAGIQQTITVLSRSLVFIVLMVVPIMFILSTLGMRRMVEPLRKMSSVALEMSRGDFAIRANETEPGEVGLLARSLNNLCITLSATIHELRSEKSQLRHILASLSEGVAATDSVGCLTIYNPALMHMFGAVRIGTRMELIPDETVWEAFDEVYRTGEPSELRFKSANDSVLWISLTPILTEDGERTGVVGLFKDMTEVENLENSRRDYIQNISHELRTPLTAMRGLLEPLSDGMVNDEEDRQRYYKIMLREVIRLSRLITDMMELSRLQSGMEYMEPRKTDVHEILDDICASYGREAQQHGITLELDAPVLPFVLTDPDRVEQILVILLSNAMRYTPEDGTIIIKAEDGPRIRVSVIDTGSGIAEEDIPNIFDRFYTADKSRKEGTTGLGLSIARELIDKLGESITVESEVGKGTRFSFTLKKYVSNAIALGPARDEWDEVEGAPIEFFKDEKVEAPEDAPYTVIGQKKAKSKKNKQ